MYWSAGATSARRVSPPSIGLQRSTMAEPGSSPATNALPITPPHNLGAKGASILFPEHEPEISGRHQYPSDNTATQFGREGCIHPLCRTYARMSQNMNWMSQAHHQRPSNHTATQIGRQWCLHPVSEHGSDFSGSPPRFTRLCLKARRLDWTGRSKRNQARFNWSTTL